jgi:hypothetical protein
MIGVGTLTTGITAEVDTDGTVHNNSVRIGWHIRSGNDWLVPGLDAPARRTRPHAAPIVHTSVRVGGGDALERVYAVGDGDGGIVVIEVENVSPEAIAVGFVVDGPGAGAGARAMVIDDDGLRVGGESLIAWARRPGAVDDEHGLVFPIPHRTKVRIALVGRSGVDVRELADAGAVERAWDRMLDRGMRTELPEPLQSEVDTARADLLLAPRSADAFGSLEAWGFDEDAVEMWGHLRTRDRRRAKRGPGAGLLAETRAALVREDRRAIELVPGFRAAWLGQSIAAHDVPLRSGVCSFAVRWHGARPALLWDVPAGFTVRAPALDPAWESTEPVGETLLAEPPTTLLSMGTRAAIPGTNVDAPEQFS